MLSATLAIFLLNPARVQEVPTKDVQKPDWPTTPRTLVSEDYKFWERLGRTELSSDGRWMTASVSLVDGDPYIVLRTVHRGNLEKIENGVSSSFSDDSKWVGVTTRPGKVESDKLREAKKPIPTTLEYWQLGTDKKTKIENIGSFRFLKGSKYLAVSVRPANPTPDATGDLHLIDLASGETERYLNVAGFSPNDMGTAMTLTVRSSTGETGVRLLDLATLRLRTLYWGKGEIGGMIWGEKSDALVMAIGESDAKKDGNAHSIHYYADVKSGKATAVLNASDVAGLSAGWRISERGGLSMSEDGKSIVFGVQEWKDKKKPSPPEKEKAGVEIWNTADKTLVPEQKLQGGRLMMQTIDYAWFPGENRTVKINDDIAQQIRIAGSRYALVTDAQKYASAKTDGVDRADMTAVNLMTGERWPVFTNAVESWVWVGETGRYIARYHEKHWWLIDLDTKKSTKLVGKGVDFENSIDDSPAKIKSAGGSIMFLKDDEAFIVHDEYDAWLGKPGDGNLVRLTNFRSQGISARFRSIEDLEGETPSLADPMYFSLTNTQTKESGMFLSDGKGGGKTLLMSADRIAGVQKAKNAEQVIYIRQNWDKSPMVVASDPMLANNSTVLTTNDQQRYFKWGTSSIVQYKSRWGVPLQGALITPADYDPNKKYPMVLYIYERVSDMGNGYSIPSDSSAYSAQVLSQNGYFVLFADIAYRTNDPGVSAVDCLEPAVDAALKANKSIDATKVGLIGHSWGAYQTAFVTTVSKKFAVGACGAPLTEMTSMYNSFYWNAGITNQVIFEQSQGRFDAPFWEIPEKYIENSPVWRSRERTAPILIAFGDKDGAVDWSQGQFLYNTLRRLGKKCVMLLYAGENHGLAQPGNQKDYAKRLRHYLDVYLKGVPAEDWVEKGVSYPDQQGGG